MKIVQFCVLLALQSMAVGTAAAQEVGQDSQFIPATLDTDGQKAVAGINRFSLDLYKRSVSPSENLFLSPASVSTAVGLAYRGAEGATAEELRGSFHYSAPPLDYPPVNAAILKSLNFSGPGRELHVSNALWIQEKFPFRAEFLADMRTYAQAGIQHVDYRRNSEAARDTINKWVANATQDKIRELLHTDDVTDQTRAVLVNTIYWKGRWASSFGPASSKVEPFTRLDGTFVSTPLMHQKAEFRALERNDVKAISLPFRVGEVDMIVLMPNSRSALPSFEAKLTSENLSLWISDLDAAGPRDTILSLPKMHLKSRNDLVPTLQAMGAPSPFGDDANFKGMAQLPSAEEPLAVGLTIKKVIHQTYLDIDEKGSEAAAATAVIMDIPVTGLAVRDTPPPPPFIFRANKPFMFLLRDRRTNLILFMGRYVTPAAEK